MADVTVNGLKINYRDTGGDGPPIVLVHGFTGIPGSQLEVIPGAGHSPTFETPEKFNAVLTGFLDRVASAAPA
jgi:pimeloyl-ACP methyl ester carboxylesterase